MSKAAAALPLYGHSGAEEKFLSARESGRLHHAWIIEGVSGIGKARFALRLASVLLGAKPVPGDPAGAPETDPVMQKLMSSGHPDLKYVQRLPNDKGVLKQDISVEQIREMNGFFSLKPALGGWRIGIIDALDEMNTNSLNAVLKTLEEPPPNALLFLISHASAPVLPTIRSRCQTLRLTPLTSEDTITVLTSLDLEAPAQVAELVSGRPGRAAEFAGVKALAAANAAKTFLRSMPRPNDAQLSQAILNAAEDEQSFTIFAEALLQWLSERADVEPSWSDVWFESQRILADQRAMHMPPAQAASKLVSTLQSAFASR